MFFLFFSSRIFQKCPDIKALWQNPRVMNNSNAATTTTSAAPADDADAPNTANRWKIELRNHGSKFFNSLDDLIGVVDKPDELFKMLHEIGVHHRNYEVKSEHIQVRVSRSASPSNDVRHSSLGYCRWTQSHHGVRSTRQMDR